MEKEYLTINSERNIQVPKLRPLVYTSKEVDMALECSGLPG